MISQPPFFIFYFLCLATLVWFYSLYLFWIRKHPLTNVVSAIKNENTFVSILVPFMNEEEFGEMKVRNLEDLDLAGISHEILFVDGGSTDKSFEILSNLLAGKSNWKVLKSPEAGKIRQLNFALEKVSADSTIIVNTDMDAKTSPSSLKKLLAILQNDEFGVAGAFVTQEDTISLDQKFWEDQNAIRLIENNYYSCTSVVAPMYAFRRNLFQKFPEDCIADDVFVSFTSNLRGKRAVYCEEATATELRGVRTFSHYVKHKFRKAVANVRETYRFLPDISGLNARWKFLFLNRAGQMIILPFVFYVFAVLSCFYLYIGTRESIGSVVVAAVVGGVAVALVPVKKNGGMISSIINLVFTNIVLIGVHLSYPFLQHDSRYKKSR